MQENFYNISIIIPVYNVENYVAACLNSLLPYRDKAEIIIVNDGSTDGSLQICNEIAKNFSHIKIISQENKGLSAARNTGIVNATGKYLVFLDSDDMLGDGSLEALTPIIESGEPDIVFTKALTLYSDGKTEITAAEYDCGNNEEPTKFFYKMLKKKNFWFAAWLCIVNREFITSNNLFFEEGIYHEDELWVPQIMLAAKTVKTLDINFYVYRKDREGSIINKKNIKKEFDKLHIIDVFKQYSVKTDRAAIKILNDRKASLLWGIINNYKHYDDNERSAELYNGIKSRLNCLKHGKYYMVYLYAKVFSLKKLLQR